MKPYTMGDGLVPITAYDANGNILAMKRGGILKLQQNKRNLFLPEVTRRYTYLTIPAFFSYHSTTIFCDSK